MNQDDLLNRKTIASNIAKLLESDADISPMLIDGEWGTGKTFLSDLIKVELDVNKVVNYIYIDAYAEDHLEEPLVMILGNISRKYSKELDTKAIDKIKKVLTQTLKRGLKTVVNIAASKLLNENITGIVEIYNKAAEATSEELFNNSIDLILKDHEEAAKNIKDLQNILCKLTNTKPLVIFIDELDRCRPDFAIKLFEKMKHVFEVKNLKFVLLANRNQLLASIKNIYGDGVDAVSYLDKFLGYSFKISPFYITSNKPDTLATMELFKRKIAEDSDLKDTFINIDNNIKMLIETLFQIHHTSLRGAKTFIRFLQIYRILSNREIFCIRPHLGKDYFRVIGTFMFCFEPEKCTAIENNSLSSAEFSSTIRNSSVINLKVTNFSLPELLSLLFADEKGVSLEYERGPNETAKENMQISAKENFGFIKQPFNCIDELKSTFKTLRLSK